MSREPLRGFANTYKASFKHASEKIRLDTITDGIRNITDLFVERLTLITPRTERHGGHT